MSEIVRAGVENVMPLCAATFVTALHFTCEVPGNRIVVKYQTGFTLQTISI